jgi:hypothetical protein
MKALIYVKLLFGAWLLASGATIHAAVVSFGTGANSFDMEFVTIGNPGNAADTRLSVFQPGSVGYRFQMGKHEVSESMVNKYIAANSLGITFIDSYGPNKPAKWISWNFAARFVNWLNTSTGGNAAYKFTTNGTNDNIALWTPADTLDYDPNNRFRSKRATYVLPDFNEWHKAAFYDPSKDGGVGGYWNYATGSDIAPTSVASGTGANTAVYGRGFAVPPADINQAGGLSPYGVMGITGNIAEWEESSFNTLNDDPTAVRAWRGGNWADSSSNELLATQGRGFSGPNQGGFLRGFRVASLAASEPPAAVPEPSSMVIGSLLCVAGYFGKRRASAPLSSERP